MATAKHLPFPDAPWGEYVTGVGIMDADAFARWNGQDGWRYELHEGRLIRMPGPGGAHGYIQTRLIRVLGAYLDAHQLGEICGTACYILTIPGQLEEILCPDISYLLPLHAAAAPWRGSYQIAAPDLVIEIASPNDTHPKVLEKVKVYQAAGVRLLWVIWPSSKTVEIWRPQKTAPTTVLTTHDMLDGADIIPGFVYPIIDLFK